MDSDEGTGHNVSMSHSWGCQTPLEERGVLPELHAVTVSPDWRSLHGTVLECGSFKSVIIPIMLRNLI